MVHMCHSFLLHSSADGHLGCFHVLAMINSAARKPDLKDTCTAVFIAALFIIARTWKQPRCPSADEWIRKLWYQCTMEYYSAIKKNTFE